VYRADIVIHSGRVYTMDEERTVFSHGAVAIAGDSIIAVGPSEDIRAKYDSGYCIDARGQIILPGFVDTHLHPVLNQRERPTDNGTPAYRYGSGDGYPDPSRHLDSECPPNPLSRIAHAKDGKNLDSFLQSARMLDTIPPVATYTFALHSMLCAVRGGATSFVEGGGGDVDGVAEAALTIGMRAGIGYPAFDQLVDLNNPSSGLQRVRDVDSVLAACEEAALRWHGRGDGLLSAWLTPVIDVACSDELLAGMKDLAGKHDLPVMTHAATTLSHDAYSLHHHNKTCIRRMFEAGLMQTHWLGIHMGYFDDTDLALLSEVNANIAHCPSTSALSGKGIMVNGQLLKPMQRGVPCGIGTDTPAQGCMLREIQVAYACHKEAQGDSRVLPAYKVLEMATRDAARAAGLAGKVGELRVGMKADIITIDMDAPEYDGLDPVKALAVHAQRRDIRNSVINGRIVMCDRAFPRLDEEAVRRDLRAANALLARFAG